MNEVRACVTKMEDIFTKYNVFPDIFEKIVEYLDDASIEECRLVSKTWKSYLDYNRHVKIRLIRKSVDRYDQVEESWEKVFKNKAIETGMILSTMDMKKNLLCFFHRSIFTEIREFATIVLWKLVLNFGYRGRCKYHCLTSGTTKL